MDQDDQILYLTVDHVVRLSARTFGWSVRHARKCLHHRLALEEVLERVEACGEAHTIDLPFRGAILVRGILDTRPFAEGNGRIALVALLTFIELNGYAVTAGQDERMAWVAQCNTLPIETLAKRIGNGIRPRWDGWKYD